MDPGNRCRDDSFGSGKVTPLSHDPREHSILLRRAPSLAPLFCPRELHFVDYLFLSTFCQLSGSSVETPEEASDGSKPSHGKRTAHQVRGRGLRGILRARAVRRMGAAALRGAVRRRGYARSGRRLWYGLSGARGGRTRRLGHRARLPCRHGGRGPPPGSGIQGRPRAARDDLPDAHHAGRGVQPLRLWHGGGGVPLLRRRPGAPPPPAERAAAGPDRPARGAAGHAAGAAHRPAPVGG